MPRLKQYQKSKQSVICIVYVSQFLAGCFFDNLSDIEKLWLSCLSTEVLKT